MTSFRADWNSYWKANWRRELLAFPVLLLVTLLGAALLVSLDRPIWEWGLACVVVGLPASWAVHWLLDRLFPRGEGA